MTQTTGINNRAERIKDVEKHDVIDPRAADPFNMDFRDIRTEDAGLVNESWSTPIPILVSVFMKC